MVKRSYRPERKCQTLSVKGRIWLGAGKSCEGISKQHVVRSRSPARNEQGNIHITKREVVGRSG